MGSDTLRLILFIAGVTLIAGIYFLGRYKRVRWGGAYALRQARKGAASQQITPVIDSAHEELFSGIDKLGPMRTDDRDTADTPFLMNMKEVEGFEMGMTPDDDPVKILQINIIAREGVFNGKDIFRAAGELGLVHGDMQIFHRYGDGAVKKRPLFSMASMVEPGIFPPDGLDAFNTPGMTLFTQLPGPMDGMVIFSDMLFSAERLASLLNGELQDEAHSDLSKQTIEQIREEILEHCRQVQLARGKR